MLESRFPELSYKIYSPRTSSNDWAAILAEIQRELAADVAVCLENSCGLSADWSFHYASADTLATEAERFSATSFGDSCSLFPDNHYPTSTTFCYQEASGFNRLMATFGLKAGIFVDCMLDKAPVARLLIGRICDIHFSAKDRNILDFVALNFTQALKSERDLLTSRRNLQLMESALGSLPGAVLIIDSEFGVIYKSKEAARMIEAGIPFDSNPEGKLMPTKPAYRPRFRGAVHAAINSKDLAHPQMPEYMCIGRHHIILRPAVTDQGDTAVSVHILDEDEALIPNKEILRKLFQFTEAEARVATLLAQGLSVDDTKTILNISRHTARNHLRSMFVKCDVTRQANLVRKIVACAAMLR